MAADLDAIRARIAAATPGERTIHPCLTWWRVFVGTDCIAEPNEHADATLIAHAPTDLAALCNEVETLRRQVAEVLTVAGVSIHKHVARERAAAARHLRWVAEGVLNGTCQPVSVETLADEIERGEHHADDE